MQKGKKGFRWGHWFFYDSTKHPITQWHTTLLLLFNMSKVEREQSSLGKKQKTGEAVEEKAILHQVHSNLQEVFFRLLLLT